MGRSNQTVFFPYLDVKRRGILKTIERYDVQANDRFVKRCTSSSCAPSAGEIPVNGYADAALISVNLKGCSVFLYLKRAEMSLA